MAFKVFGGVHPKENKRFSANCHTQKFPEPDILVIPLSQHIGVPCKPLVQKGDHVMLGQKIGDNEGLCVPVHASVSGTVKAVEMRPHASGMTMMSVVIENDHQDERHPDIKPRTAKEVAALSADELMEIIREAGVVGMGGAAFPTAVKLRSGIGKIDTLIINASECEPYIVADDRLCREFPDELVSGVQLVMKVLGLDKAVIAIESNKPEAAKSVQSSIDPRTGISMKIMPARYPQGAEKQLIQAITGRQVPSGGLPTAVGCVVLNAASCKAIHDAVYERMPLVRRIVTVSGDVVMRPKNLIVPIGTSFNDLIEAVGHSENPYKVLSGGPMMGIAQFDLSVPVTKGTNAVTILGFRDRFIAKDFHCIRCGKCIDACPMRLMPIHLYRAERKNDLQELKKLNLLDCMECGCCAFVCPATIPLVQSFRTGKQKLRDAAPKP